MKGYFLYSYFSHSSCYFRCWSIAIYLFISADIFSTVFYYVLNGNFIDVFFIYFIISNNILGVFIIFLFNFKITAEDLEAT